MTFPTIPKASEASIETIANTSKEFNPISEENFPTDLIGTTLSYLPSSDFPTAFALRGVYKEHADQIIKQDYLSHKKFAQSLLTMYRDQLTEAQTTKLTSLITENSFPLPLPSFPVTIDLLDRTEETCLEILQDFSSEILEDLSKNPQIRLLRIYKSLDKTIPFDWEFWIPRIQEALQNGEIHFFTRAVTLLPNIPMREQVLMRIIHESLKNKDKNKDKDLDLETRITMTLSDPTRKEVFLQKIIFEKLTILDYTKAKELAQSLSDPTLKDQVLRIIDALEKNDLASALKIAQTMTNSDAKILFLQITGMIALRYNKVTLAVQAAQLLPFEYLRVHDLNTIITNRIIIKNYTEAKEVALLLPTPTLKDQVSRIIDALEKNDLDLALEITQTVSYPPIQDLSLGIIFFSAIQKKDFAFSIRVTQIYSNTAQRFHFFKEIISLTVRLKNFKETKNVVPLLSDEEEILKDQVLAVIDAIEKNDLVLAVDIAGSMSKLVMKDYFLTIIIKEATKNKNLDFAITVTEMLSPDILKNQILDILKALKEDNFDLAIRLVNYYFENEDYALELVVDGAIMAGKPDIAKSAAEMISEDIGRDYALKRIDEAAPSV